jgi:hypothetical protein
MMLKVLMAYMMVLSRHYLEQNEENDKNLQPGKLVARYRVT